MRGGGGLLKGEIKISCPHFRSTSPMLIPPRRSTVAPQAAAKNPFPLTLYRETL
jgi:hypothetical protein